MVTECFEILMELLKSRKVKARYLADKMEISVRSVYRYIDVLSASGVAIFCERGRNGGIRIADNYRLPAALLSPSEQSDILAALNLYKGANPACDVENINGYFSTLSSPSGTLRMARRKLSPILNSAGQTRLPMFSKNTISALVPNSLNPCLDISASRWHIPPVCN